MGYETEITMGPFSSLAFWRCLPPNKTLNDYPTCAPTLPTCCSERGDLDKVRSLDLSILRNDFVIGSQNAKSKIRGLDFVVLSQEIPEGCFRRVKDGLNVASPEMCALLLARKLDFIEYLRLLFELCGKYSILPDGLRLRQDYPSLTSASQLRKFAEQCSNFRGSITLKKAVDHLADNSWSPMESAVCLALTLPTSRGGYGIAPLPSLNAEISIKGRAERVSTKKHLYCDLYWPDANLAVEYDSSTEHESLQAIDSDNNRRAVLGYLGVEVVTVTRERLFSPDEFDKVAIPIMKNLGKRYRIPSESISARRRELLRKLRNPARFDLSEAASRKVGAVKER